MSGEYKIKYTLIPFGVFMVTVGIFIRVSGELSVGIFSVGTGVIILALGWFMWRLRKIL